MSHANGHGDEVALEFAGSRRDLQRKLCLKWKAWKEQSLLRLLVIGAKVGARGSNASCACLLLLGRR